MALANDAVVPPSDPRGLRRRRLRRISARLPTYLANARDNPQWLAMFILGRLLPVRQALSRLSRRTVRPDGGASIFIGSDHGRILGELQAAGMFAGLRMPAPVSQEILRFAQATPCFANLNRHLEFLPSEHADAAHRFGHPILTGHFFDRVEECPAVAAVRDDPLLHGLAAGYLGDKARVISTRLWWSFPTAAASDADLSLASQEKLHFDLDDWRALKFFFYVTPVDQHAGPHVYVRGTHNRRILRHQLTLVVGHSNAEILEAYGSENQVTLLGDAGYGFVADPFGFHMGTLVRNSPRLMLEVGFGVSSALGRRFHGEPAAQRTKPPAKLAMS